jgi:hypothetical protein
MKVVLNDYNKFYLDKPAIGFKVVCNDMTAPYNPEFKWKAGRWYRKRKPPVMCEYGYHYCKSTVELYRWLLNNIITEDRGMARIFVVEIMGHISEDVDYGKAVAQKMRLIRELSYIEYIKILRLITSGSRIGWRPSSQWLLQSNERFITCLSNGPMLPNYAYKYNKSLFSVIHNADYSKAFYFCTGYTCLTDGHNAFNKPCQEHDIAPHIAFLEKLAEYCQEHDMGEIQKYAKAHKAQFEALPNYNPIFIERFFGVKL